MNRTSIRSIAAALAVAVTAGVLQGIATLAQVDSPGVPVVELPAVQIIASKPEAEPVLAGPIIESHI